MTREEELEEVKKLCNQWPPPEEPPKIDVRRVDYCVSLTPTERLRRNGPLLEIEDLMHLTDTATLHKVIDIMRSNAEKNPFWNNGEPIWQYFTDDDQPIQQ